MGHKVTHTFTARLLSNGEPFVVKAGDEIDRLMPSEEGLTRFVVYIGEMEHHCVAHGWDIKTRGQVRFI